MFWDSKTRFTRDGYRKHVQRIAYETMWPGGHFVHRIGDKDYLPHWWTDNHIYVAWEPGIPQETAEMIAQAVDERIQELWNVRFKFTMFGNHESFAEQVDASMMRGQLDEQRLFSLAASESWRDQNRGGRQHGDIYITTKPFLNDSVSWGAAAFYYGAMIFALHGQRHRSTEFLHRIALHEATHLCGMHTHCEIYQGVEGYTYNGHCNMDSGMPTGELCPKCQEYLRIFWDNVQGEYAMYLNNQVMDSIAD